MSFQVKIVGRLPAEWGNLYVSGPSLPFYSRSSHTSRNYSDLNFHDCRCCCDYFVTVAITMNTKQLILSTITVFWQLLSISLLFPHFQDIIINIITTIAVVIVAIRITSHYHCLHYYYYCYY